MVIWKENNSLKEELYKDSSQEYEIVEQGDGYIVYFPYSFKGINKLASRRTPPQVDTETKGAKWLIAYSERAWEVFKKEGKQILVVCGETIPSGKIGIAFSANDAALDYSVDTETGTVDFSIYDAYDNSVSEEELGLDIEGWFNKLLS